MSEYKSFAIKGRYMQLNFTNENKRYTFTNESNKSQLTARNDVYFTDRDFCRRKPQVVPQKVSKLRGRCHELPALSRRKYLEVLVRTEAAVAALYELFSTKLKDQRKFWRSMSQEQLAHADVVSVLSGYVESGDVGFCADKRLKEAEEVLSYVNGLLEHLRVGRITHRAALSHAVRVESVIHSAESIGVFKADSADMAREINAFQDHLSQHAQRLEAEQLRSTPLFSRILGRRRKTVEKGSAPHLTARDLVGRKMPQPHPLAG